MFCTDSVANPKQRADFNSIHKPPKCLCFGMMIMFGSAEYFLPQNQIQSVQTLPLTDFCNLVQNVGGSLKCSDLSRS